MSKIRTITIDPSTIGIPDVRLTSHMPEELRQEFQTSIGEAGAFQPPLCIKTADGFVVVDGRNRIEAAINAGARTIQIAYREGELKDVLLQNLATGHMKGRPPASDLVKVIAELTTDQGLDSEEISKATGMSRDYVEKLMVISSAGDGVLSALEAGAIGVTVAHILASVQDLGMREILLDQQLQFRWTIPEFKEHVEKAIEIREETPAPEPPAPSAPAKEPKETCIVTGERLPVDQLRRTWISADGVAILKEVKRAAESEPAPAPAS